MLGRETGGVSDFWYSFDYGLAHFIALDGETDFPYSPECPSVRDVTINETLPKENETFVTDSGPFGHIDNNEWKNNSAYQQIQWLQQDLPSLNRKKTPWIIAISHRPMYSSQTSSYQLNVRNAFELPLLQYKVDAYLSGHIHWYERVTPMGRNGTIDMSAMKDNNTYVTGTGKSLTHVINGMAGNIESHSTLGQGQKLLNITVVLNQRDYGFSTLTFCNETVATWSYVKRDGSGIGDVLTTVKR
jgi:Calcineurin-like phosphoesterase/Iron/zinc purple acid phosphatase-like protein C